MEEYLCGTEISVIGVSDGTNLMCMPPAQVPQETLSHTNSNRIISADMTAIKGYIQMEWVVSLPPQILRIASLKNVAK